MVKKIDFHIHTISSIKDSDFDFSLEWLKKYVELTNLDAIAITNHDMFDKNNFDEITKELSDIKVYPGIELALDMGHVNIVFPTECSNDLFNFSEWLSQRHKTQNDTITAEILCNNLVCWDKGIYIFELGKSNEIKEVPKCLSNVVYVGGVPNQLKFNIVKENPNSIVPCLFSDAHATDNDKNDRNNLEKLRNKQTYLQIDSCEFENIRRCLSDKSKVSINEKNLNNVININGVNVSTGLNLVVGKRGTGKTYFLSKIKEEYCDSDDYYEIKQFETANAEEYIEKQRKNQGLEALKLWQRKYETEFATIKKYLQKNESDFDDIEAFLGDIKQFANELAQSKSKQKYRLFKETEFELVSTTLWEGALSDIKRVIDKEEIWGILSDGIQKKNYFKKVYSELRDYYMEIDKHNRVKVKTNEVMKLVKSVLSSRTGITSIKKCSINEIVFREQIERKINDFLNEIVIRTTLKNERIHGYQVQVSIAPYMSASEFQQEIKTSVAVKDDLMKAYQARCFTKFLNILKNKAFYNEANLAEYLVRKEVKLLDSDGVPASGGQAVGFALMLRLNEAKMKPIILIDEPESSLDNAYIRSDLNQALRNLANHSMVVVITHNSTLGTLLEPDYLVVTSKSSDGKYSVMSGEFSSRIIRDTLNGIEEQSHDKFIEAMESGIDAFIKKGVIYENLNY